MIVTPFWVRVWTWAQLPGWIHPRHADRVVRHVRRARLRLVVRR